MFHYTNYYDLESIKYNRTKKIKFNILCVSFIIITFIIFKTISSLPIYNSNNIDNIQPRLKYKQKLNLNYDLPIKKINITSIYELDKYIAYVYNELDINIPSKIGLSNSLKYLNIKLQELDTIEDKYTFNEINILRFYILENINKYKIHHDQL